MFRGLVDLLFPTPSFATLSFLSCTTNSRFPQTAISLSFPPSPIVFAVRSHLLGIVVFVRSKLFFLPVYLSRRVALFLVESVDHLTPVF
jgi:hypothetical protein